MWVDVSGTYVRIVGDEPVPALFPLEMFEIVQNTIPPSWVVTSPREQCISIAPEPWTRAGFWEDFFDGAPAALASFSAERNKIIDAGSMAAADSGQ